MVLRLEASGYLVDDTARGLIQPGVAPLDRGADGLAPSRLHRATCNIGGRSCGTGIAAVIGRPMSMDGIERVLPQSRGRPPGARRCIGQLRIGLRPRGLQRDALEQQRAEQRCDYHQTGDRKTKTVAPVSHCHALPFAANTLGSPGRAAGGDRARH